MRSVMAVLEKSEIRFLPWRPPYGLRDALRRSTAGGSSLVGEPPRTRLAGVPSVTPNMRSFRPVWPRRRRRLPCPVTPAITPFRDI